jgi:hypothetical protein
VLVDVETGTVFNTVATRPQHLPFVADLQLRAGLAVTDGRGWRMAATSAPVRGAAAMTADTAIAIRSVKFVMRGPPSSTLPGVGWCSNSPAGTFRVHAHTRRSARNSRRTCVAWSSCTTPRARPLLGRGPRLRRAIRASARTTRGGNGGRPIRHAPLACRLTFVAADRATGIRLCARHRRTRFQVNGASCQALCS